MEAATKEEHMTARFVFTGLALSAVLATANCTPNGGTYRTVLVSTLEDKIRGGWAGQMIGVSFGAPTEFRFLGQLVPEEELPEWHPEMVTNALYQDDLYVDMTFAAVLDERGLDATTDDFGAMFHNAEYHLWHANLAARRALRRGVPPTLSGTPAYNAHANDIDFQIEADFIGLMAPGLPQASNDLCLRAGRVMNYGDGILGGVFVSGMYAAAFFESDPRSIVEAGLATLPRESPYAQVISDVLEWSRQFPDDWTQVWQLVNEKWDRREPCPAGALHPFNIDAKINGAYVALGLLYGRGDFYDTMVIATRAGQDSDCNPASAAGVLGVVLGFENIPDEYKSGIPAIADERFSYTDYTFNTIVASTLRRAIALVERHGGRVDGDSVTVRMQDSQPISLELWDDYGSPVERVSVDDPRWTFRGAWEQVRSGSGNWGWRARQTGAAGAEASIQFEGTGVILGGSYLPSGGVADIYLDGELHRTVDVYSDEDARKSHEAVWHAFGLGDGEHSLRVVVRGERYVGPGGDESSGTDVSLSYLVVFR
jgi:hypothetical protein